MREQIPLHGHVESLQSHLILTMSHWSSGLPVCFPSQGTQVQIPWGDLCKTGILLLALSCYIGDPDVIDHHCSLVWGGLRPKLSLGPRANNVIIPLDLTQLFCPGFPLTAGLPSSFTTDGVGCWGEPCGEPAISLHCHHVSLVQWTTCLLLITREPGSNPLGGLIWNQDSPVSVVLLQASMRQNGCQITVGYYQHQCEQQRKLLGLLKNA
jgi:hypothetical protein